MTKPSPINLLLIEDEDYDVARVRNTIQQFRERIQLRDIVSSGSEAVELISANPDHYDVVVMDYQISGGLSGENLIRKIKSLSPTAQIIVITKRTINLNDLEFANRLIDSGAMWYCTKYPGDIEDYIYQPTDFVLSIFNAYEKAQLERDKNRSTNRLRQNIADAINARRIVGESPPMKALRQRIRQCANMDANVLIFGASGTGKELVAANIHYRSERSLEQFVPVNCGSLPDDLIESELFGFSKGSFTGAATAKKGLFEVAHKGTIFLDEVAELPLAAQVKLLRVLQNGEIDKIGRTGSLKVDARVIAATNKDLEVEVREKRFREDLYYRLNVVSINVPSLKERPDDIPDLLQHFLEKYSRKMGNITPVIQPTALDTLKRHQWPGNVRQLENLAQRLLFEGNRIVDEAIMSKVLGLSTLSPANTTLNWDPNNIMPLREIEEATRREYFIFVRNHTESDAEAARKLGLAPPNYYRMSKKLGLK